MSANVFQIVTERILEELEQEIIPWEKPWTGVRSGAYSRSTGKPYSLTRMVSTNAAARVSQSRIFPKAKMSS